MAPPGSANVSSLVESTNNMKNMSNIVLMSFAGLKWHVLYAVDSPSRKLRNPDYVSKFLLKLSFSELNSVEFTESIEYVED